MFEIYNMKACCIITYVFYACLIKAYLLNIDWYVGNVTWRR